MKKLKLLLAACALFGVSAAWAQTNLIAGWDGGNNTSSPSNFGWTSSANRTLQPRNNNGGIRMTTTYSGYKDENGNNYAYSSTSDPSSVIFWVRYNTSGESFTYTFKGLEPNYYYDFSALVGWHNNSSNPTFTVKINDSTSDLVTLSKAISTKSTLYEVSSRFKTPSTITNTTDIKIVFTCNQTGDCMEAISALRLVNVVLKDELTAAITYASRVNTTLDDATLASEITKAQEIYDNGSATQIQVNDAVSTLSTAVATALGSAAPADMTFVLANPGFESSTAISANQATGSSRDYSSSDWTVLSTSTSNSCGAVVEYSSSYTLNNVNAPSNDNKGASGNTLGISIGWNTTVAYQSSSVTLPAGSYTMTVYGYNNNSEGNNFTSKNGFITSNTSFLSNKSSFTYNEWQTDVISFSLAEPTTGVFQLGGTASNNTSTTHAKVFFDNINISYESPLANAARLFTELIETAKGITDSHEAAIKSALADAITTAEAVSATTVEEYNDARNELQTAINNSNNSISYYQNTLRPIINKLKTYASYEDNLADMETDYNNGVYTSSTDKAALIAQYQTLEIAALQAADATNYTSAIINPDFEFDAAAISIPTGWSRTNSAKENGTRNTTVSNMSGWYYNAYQEWWDSNIDIKQTITGLPNGEYEIGATLAGWSGCTVNLTANSDFSYINGAGDAVGVSATVTTFVTDGTLNIKVNWGVREGGTFFKCDNFTLTYNGIKPMLLDAISTANTIKTSNVGSGAFQIPSTAQSSFNAAITTAQGIYDDSSATLSEVQKAIDNLNDAKGIYFNKNVNGPVSGVQYRIKSTAADAAAWKNQYYVLKKDAGQANGGYSTRAEVDDKAFYATAWKFTSVSGNTYKLSMIDADGNERYLCTNIKGYDQGSATQIRTTTDPDKALVVKVIAATGTDGRWFLQNTEDDSYLGGQDAGLFSNSQNYDLVIEAASKANVDVSIGSTIKFATRIFPFTPSLPDGLKAYSCEATEDDVLTLVKVDAPAANTPYILYAASGYEGAALTGYGTASSETYTEGLLTGVYTATTAPVNSYVLQNNDPEGVGFYQVESDNQPSVGANRCYLTVPDPSRKAFFFDFGGESTAINAINALTSGDVQFYNAAGARVPGLQKGMNIVKKADGKTFKVMVK